ncbi:MAG: DUF1801 domain-containing protein [Candidatus Dormibacteraeota bacterium]|nr:DUF1801 domain-containing protein [Candidatus Dormibacteraeota bacterium]
MSTDPAVDRWFSELDHPLKEVMLQVRDVFLGVDERVGECIKWKSPTFTFRGNIASIDPRVKRQVNVMFHQGASLPGEHPGLEGGGGAVRYMRFTDLEEAIQRRAELESAVHAWIELKSAL